jgi:3',5'-cyclic AMP phosphodiesterase CpdA
MTSDHDETQGVSRRKILECMTWAGTGVLWTIAGGVPRSTGLIGEVVAAEQPSGLTFLQISDSHVGFDKPANPNALGTLEEAINKIKALPVKPAFLIHTGDITHLSKLSEFDDADRIISQARLDVHYVPGEHDVIDPEQKLYRERYGRGAQGAGWYSFDANGVHFIGLVNVVDLKAGGLGNLGNDQLEWLESDLKGRSASTPIVVFAHIPLWSVYPQWGWGTDDAARALDQLKRFGSVTVLNGHIHQIMQKVVGHMSFHTAMSTAFPQPAPGTAPSPGPMKVDPERLRSVLGITDVTFVPGRSALAVVDATLSGQPPAFAVASHDAMMQRQTARQHAALGPGEIGIDNFNFTPPSLSVKAGTTVTWINDDDVPHLIVSVRNRFASSPVLDSGQRYSVAVPRAGTDEYFCSLHPKMQGRIIVT